MVFDMRGSMVVFKKGSDGVRLTVFENTVYLETAPDTTSIQASRYSGDEEESRAFYNKQMIALGELGFKQVQLDNNVKSFEQFPWSQFEEGDPTDNTLAKNAIAPHEGGNMWLSSWSEAELALPDLSSWIREAAPTALLAKRLPDEVLPDLAESLKELYLDHPLQTMAKSCRRKHLELTQVIDYCTELETLLVIGKFVLAIEFESTSLKSLSLASDPLSANTYSMLQASILPNLEELNLGCAHEEQPIEDAGPAIAALLAQKVFPSLKRLGLFSPPTDDAFMEALFERASGLKQLTLSSYTPSDEVRESAKTFMRKYEGLKIIFEDDDQSVQAVEGASTFKLFTPSSYGFEERFSSLRNQE